MKKVKVKVEFRDINNFATVYSTGTVVEFDEARTERLISLGLVENIEENKEAEETKASEATEATVVETEEAEEAEEAATEAEKPVEEPKKRGRKKSE